MVLSSIDLWQRIASEGLASPMQCRSWAAETAKGMPAADTTDGLKVLQSLIEIGKLTNYQAKILAGQSDRPLHRGPWSILRRVKQPLWNDWLEVIRIDLTKAEPPSATWARWLAAADLEALRSSAPSLPRGLQLSKVSHPHLQEVLMPLLVDGELQLQVAPVHGKLLSERFAGQSPSLEQTTLIVVQVAEALAALHAAGLNHGRVLPDRIYFEADEVTLARDPIAVLTATLDHSAVGLLGERLVGMRTEHFLAPEFLAPGQVPTLSSDIYALGCTWWWLLTGEAPATGNSPQEILASHTGASVRLPGDCDYPEPLARCLEHCLAKNSDARFVSAIELRQALAAAQQAVAAGKQGLPAAAAPQGPIVAMLQTSAVAAPRSSASAQPASGALASAEPAPAQGVPDDVAVARRKAPERAERAERATPTAPSTRPAPASNVPVAAIAGAAAGRLQRRKRASNRWLLPVVGGCGFLALLLLILKLSGALESGRVDSPTAGNKPHAPPAVDAPVQVQRDPRLEMYRLVEPNAERLWAPPELPDPIALDLLPPGGQLFVSLRPADLMNHPQRRKLIAALDTHLTPLLDWIADGSGQPLEAIDHMTVAFYGAKTPGAPPEAAMRVELSQPKPLSQLIADWRNPAKAKAGEQELFVDDNDRAYYVANQPLTDTQSVSAFSVGPAGLMRDVAALSGGAAPLITPMETLWQRSNRRADVGLLLSPRYLFSEGRGLLEAAPPRLQDELKDLFSTNTRAGLVQSWLEPQWYFEAQIIGNSDRDAPPLAAKLQKRLAMAPAETEEWFVEQSPHPHWRALAIRYPRMLRQVADYARFGVEDGVALMNAYLPAEAAANVTLASWIALQDGATLANDMAASEPARGGGEKPLTVDEYLGRKIRLKFDQEPIEVALRLIGDEANAGLPAGSPQLRFALDGSAFEKAGITRNQQLRDFDVNDKPVREALTEVAKRGNPVTTVTDTSDADQRLIWILTSDPEAEGKQMISLTTRDAATAANIPLPAEFAP